MNDNEIFIQTIKEDQKTPEEKANLLIEFVNAKKRLPKSNEEYKGVKIGGFWVRIKQGQNKAIYDEILSKNEIVKNGMEKYLKDKEDKIAPEDRANLLIVFVDAEKRLPKSKEEYKGVKIGIFWRGIKRGQSKHIYDEILSKNEIVKNDMEKYLKDKEERLYIKQ